MSDTNITGRSGLSDIKKNTSDFFKNAGEKATELWNGAIEGSEKAIKETSENISELWDNTSESVSDLWNEANETIDKVKEEWDNSSEAEKQFCKDHPIAAFGIGKYRKGSNNISTVATDFALMGRNKASNSILSGENKTVGTGGQNAMRHVLLQAFTTSEYGENIAKQAGDAHEDNIQIDMEQTHFKTYDEADMAVDQRNNAIGRNIATNSSADSKLELTKEAVEEFRKEGFWIAYKTDEGYEVRQTKLGKNRYEDYKKGLENKDENAQWVQIDK